MALYVYPSNVETELKNAYIGIPYPESISLDKSSISLTTIWQTEQLTATIEPTVSDKTITWTSSDNTIATVSSSWLVTCVTPWECTITATTVNGLTATCSVAQSRLPSTYQEVEYIQSDGWQYINTTHKHTANSKVELKLSYQNMTTEWNLLRGSRSSNVANDAFAMFVHWSYDIWASVWWQDYISLASTTTDTIYEISLSASDFTINWTSTALSTNLTSYAYDDLLFTFFQNGSPVWWCYNVKAKMYYCKIYESDTLVRDLVPCYRIADSVIWMYDLVNGVFYTNSWTWTFTKWADV